MVDQLLELNLGTGVSYYAQSNGSAEVRVGNCKKVMVKTMETEEDVDKALSMYRNMPTHDGHTPSSMFFRRILRSPDLPSLERKYTEECRLRDEENRGSCHRQSVERLNEQRGERKLRKPIEVGTKCWVQDGRPAPAGTKLWDRQSTVTEVRPSGSYKLVDEEGTVSIRKGKTLKPVFVKKAPKIKDIAEEKKAKEKGKKSWADAVKNSPNRIGQAVEQHQGREEAQQHRQHQQEPPAVEQRRGKRLKEAEGHEEEKGDFQ